MRLDFEDVRILLTINPPFDVRPFFCTQLRVGYSKGWWSPSRRPAIVLTRNGPRDVVEFDAALREDEQVLLAEGLSEFATLPRMLDAIAHNARGAGPLARFFGVQDFPPKWAANYAVVALLSGLDVDDIWLRAASDLFYQAALETPFLANMSPESRHWFAYWQASVPGNVVAEYLLAARRDGFMKERRPFG